MFFRHALVLLKDVGLNRRRPFWKKESSLWDRELSLSEALAFYAAPALDHQGCLRIFLQLFPPHAP